MAQHVKHDELEQMLEECAATGENLIELLAMFAHSVADRWDIAEYYHGKVREIADKWSDGKNLAAGVKELCSVLFYFYTTKFDKVGAAAEKSIAIFENVSAPELLGVSYMIKGVTQRSQGQFDEAIANLGKAAGLIKKDGLFRVYYAFSNYQIAEIFVQLGDLELAEQYYLDADQVAKETTDETAKFRMTNGLGNYYVVTEQYDKAKEYLTLADEMASSPVQKSRSLCDLGIFELKKGNSNEAIALLQRSFDIRVEYGYEDATSTSLIHLGLAYEAIEDYEKAADCGIKALEITEKFSAKQKELLALGLLGSVHDHLGNWELATKFLKRHRILQDDLNTQQMRRIYKTKNKMIEAQKALIEEAHQEIKDSIIYAKRIQTAILPPKSIMNTALEDHFVLYKPKDVVAGDFYWVEKGIGVDFFAAADCTGHGVPGAMVSVVCNNALNRSVREYGLTMPGKILDKTREIIIEEFEKAEEDVKDGMDICLCAKRGMTLQFSGAHNPLWLIRDGEIIEYKGDKQPVGKFAASKAFNTQTISLRPGDTYYIFTDGFVDQFGGPKGKKFKAKQLRELLLSIQDRSIKAHHDILEEAFETWRGSLEQIDDVCIIGVRV